ncbi:MAG: alkaline phosphatase family protein [Ignisphaera sp.]
MKKFDKLILFVYIDALDFNKLNLLLRKTSFFPKIIDMVLPLKNIPGYSFGIQTTLLTGKFPQEHKHWMPYIYLGEGAQEKERNMERIRKALIPIKRLLPLRLRFNNKIIELLFTQSNSILHRAIIGRKALLSSTPLEWFDKIYVYPYYYMSESPFFKILVKEIRNKGYQTHYLGHSLSNCVEEFASVVLNFYRNNNEKVMLFLYIDDIDGISHKYGTSASRYLNTLLSIDVFLHKVLEVCESISKDFIFLIFSDHGICDTTGKVDLVRILKHIIKYVEFAVIDATLAFIWLRDDSRVDDIASYLELQLHDQAMIFTLLHDKHELKRYGVCFNNREYGDIIIQLKPCKIFYPNSYSSLWWLKALHGFWPTEEAQQCFLAIQSSATYDGLLYNIRSVADIRDMLIRFTY